MWPVILYTIASFIDVSTTMYGLGRGCVKEANPLFKPVVKAGPVVAGAVKGGAVVGVDVLALKHPGPWVNRSMWAVAGGQVAVDVLNVRALRGCK